MKNPSTLIVAISRILSPILILIKLNNTIKAKIPAQTIIKSTTRLRLENDSSIDSFNLTKLLNNIPTISRQSIYNFKREVKIRNINYKEINVNKTLYVMVDEKWIHKQDKNNHNKKKWIMSKCFVTFTSIKNKGKRNKLIGRHIFITSSNTPWKDFMSEIYKIYNFEKL